MGSFARLRFERRRRRALAAAIPNFLRTYLETPIPAYAGPAATAPILSVDFETNGLNLEQDHILSIGSIDVDAGAIAVDTGWHTLVASDRALDVSVVPVHQITHDTLKGGIPVEAALETLFARLQGRFLLAHHAWVETGFLAALLLRLYGVRVPFLAIDTLLIERAILARQHSDDSVRLIDARKRYGLPHYRSHQALTDALAAAELFLAQCRHHYPATAVHRLLTPFFW